MHLNCLRISCVIQGVKNWNEALDLKAAVTKIEDVRVVKKAIEGNVRPYRRIWFEREAGKQRILTNRGRTPAIDGFIVVARLGGVFGSGHNLI